MTGGKFEDGSGRGFVPQQTTGDGACFFHGIANAAFGMKCKGRRGVLAYALPIRFACLKTALASMEAVLSMDGWGCALPSPHLSEFLLPNLSTSLPFLGMWDSVVGNLAPCQQLQMRRLRKRRTLHVSCVHVLPTAVGLGVRACESPVGAAGRLACVSHLSASCPAIPC